MDVNIIHKDLNGKINPILNTSAIVWEKMLIAFKNPNGITFHSKNLYLVITTIF
jgi:hypothetical protein